LYAVGDHASADYWPSRTRAVFKAWEHRERQLLRLAQQPAAVDGCHCATCTCSPGMTPSVRFDLSSAQQEGAVRDHLIRLGWTPPNTAPPPSAPEAVSVTLHQDRTGYKWIIVTSKDHPDSESEVTPYDDP